MKRRLFEAGVYVKTNFKENSLDPATVLLSSLFEWRKLKNSLFTVFLSATQNEVQEFDVILKQVRDQ